jgi:hypothetical protein
VSIPADLIALPQWVLWREEHRGGAKPTKVPYNTAGHPADITDNANYAAYENVINGHSHGYSGKGFVLVRGGKITAIDLDNPFQAMVNGVLTELPRGDEWAESILKSHLWIIEKLNSYTEWSPSHKGFRIFIYGELPEGWRNRVGKVEIYSHSRFMTVTGNHVAGTPLTIEHRQTELEQVGALLELDKATSQIEYAGSAQTRSDADVYNAIVNSKVGDDFLRLYRGDASSYGSGSEADQALANYICFATDNKEQAYRMFLASQHYANRPKLHDRTEYLVGRVINNGFDKKPQPIDISALNATASAVEVLQQEAPEIGPDPEGVTVFPDGMLGFIAEYIMKSAPFAVPEYALAGAIGLLAGIAGRSFNINGAGLNQYVVLVGRSGSGKDSVPNGISRLLGELEQTIPAARLFQGPRGIASAPALYKLFDREKGGSPSQVCMIPEFGEFLKTHTDPKADGTKQGLVAALMEIYGKSGAGHEAGSIAYSDRDKNVKSAKSPALSLIGDTVANSFYEACTEAQMIKGLVPRMFVIERTAKRPLLNPMAHLYRPDPEMINRFGYLVTRCLELNEANQVVGVGMMDDAKAVLDNFYIECDNAYNSTNSDAIGNIYSRAHLKAVKLAALAAVGYNWINPHVYAVQAEWAVTMARRDIKNMLKRVTSGEIEMSNSHIENTGFSSEQVAIASVYLAHVSRKWADLPKDTRKANPEAAHNAGWMPESLLRNMCCYKPVFRKIANSGQKNAAVSSVLKKDFTGVFRIGMASTLEPSAQHTLGVSNDREFVVCTDMDMLKVIAAAHG